MAATGRVRVPALVQINATNGRVANEALFTIAAEGAGRVHADGVVSMTAVNAGCTFIIGHAGTVDYSRGFIPPHRAHAVECPNSVDAARP